VRGWSLLEDELAAWRRDGREVTLWCRDDDAVRDTAALQRLLSLVATRDVPVAIAVVPAGLEPSLVETLRPVRQASVLQHGYAHRNHAPEGERSAELGAHRPAGRALAELAWGRERLAGAFGDRFVPALVPPWNRIDAALLPALPGMGLCGLSTFGARVAGSPVPGVVACNTHVDLIAWRRGRHFVGTDTALARLVEHLAARRAERVDPVEPTGVLSHHLDLQEEAWTFLDALFRRTTGLPGVRWLAARELFTSVPHTGPAREHP
jgi:hypothetical protein